jgi:hypothetical protein
MRNTHTLLVGKREEKTPQERSRRAWENIIKIEFRDI